MALLRNAISGALRSGFWPFGLNDDDAVRATRAVHGRLSGALQHLDRLDVVRVDPAETPVRSRLDGHAIDLVQRVAVSRLRAADTYGDSAVGCARDDDAREAPRQRLVNLAWAPVEILGRHGGASRGRAFARVAGTRPAFA